jgi:hypothetical protein
MSIILPEILTGKILMVSRGVIDLIAPVFPQSWRVPVTGVTARFR